MTNSISGPENLHRLLTPSLDDISIDGGHQPQVNGPAADGVDFQKLLLDALDATNASENQALQAIESHQTDGPITRPEVFIAIRKAELALRMTMQIRNKILEAYQEIQQMRM